MNGDDDDDDVGDDVEDVKVKLEGKKKNGQLLLQSQIVVVTFAPSFASHERRIVMTFAPFANCALDSELQESKQMIFWRCTKGKHNITQVTHIGIHGTQ